MAQLAAVLIAAHAIADFYLLIFLFIFIGQPAGIGFLVAAKSILRFEEARQQKLAEYVLIGTLLSFSLAVALAAATQWAAGKRMMISEF